jgi:hypothetical protein
MYYYLYDEQKMNYHTLDDIEFTSSRIPTKLTANRVPTVPLDEWPCATNF